MKELNVYSDKGSVDLSIIEEHEQLIGYRFPNSYKKLIGRHDQLRPIEDHFDFTNIYGEKDERDISFLGHKNSTTEKLMDSQDYDIYGYEGIVTFGICANGDHICFDYRHDPETDEPHVVVMYHDDYVTDKDGNPKRVINFVAPSFEAFVDILYEYIDEDTDG